MIADDIFDTLRPIILASTGVTECLYAQPNAPAPAGEYCTISINANASQRGQAIIYQVNSVGPNAVDTEVVPQVVAEASVQFFRGAAIDYAVRLHQANKIPSVSAALFAAGLGWQRTGPVNKLTALQTATFEPRAQISIFLLHEVRFASGPETGNSIERVPYDLQKPDGGILESGLIVSDDAPPIIP